MTESQRVERVEVDGGSFATTIVLPSNGATRGSGILLLQEIFGVNEFLLGKAKDLAELGYVVSCPDVFWRIEPGVALPHDDESLGKAYEYVTRYSELDEATSRADLVAALHHLRGLDEVRGGVAVMGYCLGGRLAYELAIAADPDACVSYYGSGIGGRLEHADEITCPVLFHYGGTDPFIPDEEALAVRDAFVHRDDVQHHIHDGAGHAFENLFAPAFANPEASARSWPLTVDFLGQHL